MCRRPALERRQPPGYQPPPPRWLCRRSRRLLQRLSSCHRRAVSTAMSATAGRPSAGRAAAGSAAASRAHSRDTAALPGLPPGQRQPRGTPGRRRPPPPHAGRRSGDRAAGAEDRQTRQATFSGLDKITGRIITFDVAISETVQFGALQVTPRACYTRPPTETPNTDAFVEVDEITLQGEIKRHLHGLDVRREPRPQRGRASDLRRVADRTAKARRPRRSRKSIRPQLPSRTASAAASSSATAAGAAEAPAAGCRGRSSRAAASATSHQPMHSLVA